MISMVKSTGKCQAVPDRVSGIVVGIDVSKRKMDFAACRLDEQSRVYSVRQSRSGYDTLGAFLDELRSSGYEPWVAFEPTGAYSTCLREWLIASGEHVVQVNPYHVKRTKEIRDNSPEKSDHKDPRVIADLVWHGCYQDITALADEYVELRCASAEWARLSKDKAALRNEFQCLLEVWFPEIADVFKDPLCRSVRALVRRYADANEIAAARSCQIGSVLRKASLGRTVGRAEMVKYAAKRSIAPSRGQKARHQAMVHLLNALELIELRRDHLKLEMQELLDGLAEAQYLLNLPGIGVITVAGILGECGPMNGFRSYDQLEKFVGLNLFEISSGQHKGQKHISKRGRALARYLICQAAMQQIRCKGLFRLFAEELKYKGAKTGQIRVAVARKLLRLIYAIARDKKEFDPDRFFTGAQVEDGVVSSQGTQAQAA